MSDMKSRGTAGEDLAARFLEYKGLTILTRNFSCRYGEIDLVARDGEDTVFVEVKLRRNADYGYAAEAVTPSKRAKLRRTALFWLQRFGEVPARFDVLEIYDEYTPVRIHWIRNAF